MMAVITIPQALIRTAEQKQAEALDAAWVALREKRDRLLSKSDWIVTRSVETGEPVPESWLIYRQGLRDLPEQTFDPVDPVWPVSPA